jgi:preprotein translocase subunit SecD
MKKICILFTAFLLISCSENNFNKEFLSFELRLVDSEQNEQSTKMIMYGSQEKFFIRDSVYLNNDHIVKTELIDWQNQPKVLVTLNENGREEFAQFTGNNVGNSAAMVVDNKLVSAPRINARINGGQLIIVGFFNHEEAQSIAEGILSKK